MLAWTIARATELVIEFLHPSSPVPTLYPEGEKLGLVMTHLP